MSFSFSTAGISQKSVVNDINTNIQNAINQLRSKMIDDSETLSTNEHDESTQYNKRINIDPDKVVLGMWEDSPNSSKNSKIDNVEKSQLESIENVERNGIIEETKTLTLDNLTKDVLKTKPLYSPAPERWLGEGGSIEICADGNWIYTNSDGISVKYVDGYPDFKGAGLVIQEVDVGEFISRDVDGRKARNMVEQSQSTVWHHPPNGNVIQEIDAKIHSQFTHMGGISKLKKGD